METVRDVMTPAVLSVRPDTPLKDVARQLIEHRISGLPVVSEDGRIVGVISEGDLLAKEQQPQAVHHRPLARLFGESAETRQVLAKAEARTAGDAMTSPAVTIEATRPVAAAATLMMERRVNRLPVTDGDQLVGIVTRADIVRTFARSDDDLAEAIRRDVLLHSLWLDPDAFAVQVENGIASISGRVERRSTAAIVERMAEMVPGVVGVNADIGWSLDDRNLRAPAPDYVSPKSPT